MITINQIDELNHSSDVPLYVLVAGGIAAGKSTTINKNIKTIPIMDLDDLMIEMGYTDYTASQFDHAMELIADKIKTLMDDKKSLVAMGTSSNIVFTINKLHWAKQQGYRTILVYINTPYDKCIEYNKKRIENGGRGITVSEHKLKKTNTDARYTVSIVSQTDLVDDYIEVDNK